jgi:putative transposase
VDEVLLTINGERHDLWRAVDQEGNVLDSLGQRRRDKQTAKTCFRKRLDLSARFRDTTSRCGTQGTSVCHSPARLAGPQERRGLGIRVAGDSGMPFASILWRGVLCRPILTRDPHR